MKLGKKEPDWADICLALAGLFLYIADVGTDIYAAVVHGIDRQYVWMGLSIVFIYLPRLIICIFFCCGKMKKSRNILLLKFFVPGYMECFIIRLHLGQMQYMYRSIRRRKEDINQNEDKYAGAQVYTLMQDIVITMATVGVVFQATPQALLQLYTLFSQMFPVPTFLNSTFLNNTIINNTIRDNFTVHLGSLNTSPTGPSYTHVVDFPTLTEKTINATLGNNTVGNGTDIPRAQNIYFGLLRENIIGRICGIVASFLTIACGFVRFYACHIENNEVEFEDSRTILMTFNFKDLLLQFLWRAPVIMARILALALFASRYNFIFIAFPLAHMIITCLMINIGDLEYNLPWRNPFHCCVSTCLSGLDFTLASKVPIAVGRVIGRLVYSIMAINYSLLFAENAIMMLLITLNCSSSCQLTEHWYMRIALIVVLGAPVIGLAFCVIFYCRLHDFLRDTEHQLSRHLNMSASGRRLTSLESTNNETSIGAIPLQEVVEEEKLDEIKRHSSIPVFWRSLEEGQLKKMLDSEDDTSEKVLMSDVGQPFTEFERVCASTSVPYMDSESR